MKRTTIMTDERVMARLRSIAERENLSLAAVIRQGLDLRIARQGERLHFLGVGRSEPGSGPTAREASEISPEPQPWR